MSLETDIRLLGRVALLSGLTDDQLRLVAFSAERAAYEAGARIHTRGQWADGALVISEGTVALHFGAADGQPADMAGPGDLIDGLALVVDGTHGHTAIAREETTVIVIRRALFRRMLEEYPGAAEAVRLRLAEGLAGTTAALARVRDRLDGLEGGG